MQCALCGYEVLSLTGTDSRGLRCDTEGQPELRALRRGAECSFPAAAEREIVRDVTEKRCYIGLDYDTELKSITKTDKTKICELTDRNCIIVCTNVSIV